MYNTCSTYRVLDDFRIILENHAFDWRHMFAIKTKYKSNYIGPTPVALTPYTFFNDYIFARASNISTKVFIKFHSYIQYREHAPYHHFIFIFIIFYRWRVYTFFFSFFFFICAFYAAVNVKESIV